MDIPLPRNLWFLDLSHTGRGEFIDRFTKYQHNLAYLIMHTILNFLVVTQFEGVPFPTLTPSLLRRQESRVADRFLRKFSFKLTPSTILLLRQRELRKL